MEQYSGIVMMVLMLVIFYFFLIRPQKKREKEMKAMIDALKVGDKIVTIGGIHGKITAVKDEILEIDTGALNNRSSLKISRWAVKECLTVKDDE